MFAAFLMMLLAQQPDDLLWQTRWRHELWLRQVRETIAPELAARLEAERRRLELERAVEELDRAWRLYRERRGDGRSHFKEAKQLQRAWAALRELEGWRK